MSAMAAMVIGSASRGALFEQKSDETKTSLLELYSSEGCNSCPPAEEWFGRLKENPGLWKDVVPVAFHVDYWDNLGWPDRFARKEYTARQYRYAHDWKAGSVYTPGFVWDGREWHISKLPGHSAVKAGVLTVKETEPGKFNVSFVGTAKADWEFNVAVLGFDLSSKVTAGENAGRTLTHDFVVLDFHQKTARGGEAVFELKRPQGKEASRLALAVWVSESGKLEPVQALGGWWER